MEQVQLEVVEVKMLATKLHHLYLGKSSLCDLILDCYNTTSTGTACLYLLSRNHRCYQLTHLPKSRSHRLTKDLEA